MCVKPFDVSNGHPNCDWGGGGSIGWSRLGCVYYDIVSVESCTESNGTWKKRAFDESTCTGHGQGCNERNFWQLTPKQGSVCTDCDGTPAPYYNWNGGAWITGEMQPLAWKTREFTSINAWQPTLNWTKLYTEVEEVANLIVSKAIKSSLMCRFNLKSAALAKVACDCGTETHTDCFETIKDVSIGEQTFFSGIGGVAEWSGVSITVDTTGVPAQQDDALIEAKSTGDVKVLLATNTLQQVGRKRSPSSPNIYEVVTNDIDYIVGQLVSDGVTLVIPMGVTITVCINLDQGIPRDPEMLYPTRDFAEYNATSGPGATPNWTPLNYGIAIVGNITQFCSDVNVSGTFYAILRVEDWESATAPTAAPTAINATLSPTTAPPTFAPVESTLSAATIVSIIIGGLVGVTLIAVFILVCARGAGPEEVDVVEAEAEPLFQQQRVTQRTVATRRTRHGINIKKQE